MRYHINEWPWGRTCHIITNDASGKIKLSFSHNNKGVCFISELSVLPLERKKGIATMLMAEAEKFCKQCGIFRIDLDSVKTPFVLNFYKKLGYVELPQDSDFIPMYKMLC